MPVEAFHSDFGSATWHWYSITCTNVVAVYLSECTFFCFPGARFPGICSHNIRWTMPYLWDIYVIVAWNSRAAPATVTKGCWAYEEVGHFPKPYSGCNWELQRYKQVSFFYIIHHLHTVARTRRWEMEFKVYFELLNSGLRSTSCNVGMNAISELICQSALDTKSSVTITQNWQGLQSHTWDYVVYVPCY